MMWGALALLVMLEEYRLLAFLAAGGYTPNLAFWAAVAALWAITAAYAKRMIEWEDAALMSALQSVMYKVIHMTDIEITEFRNSANFIATQMSWDDATVTIQSNGYTVTAGRRFPGGLVRWNDCLNDISLDKTGLPKWALDALHGVKNGRMETLGDVVREGRHKARLRLSSREPNAGDVDAVMRAIDSHVRLSKVFWQEGGHSVQDA